MTGKYVQLIFYRCTASLALRVISKHMTLTILKFNLPGSGKTAAFLVPMLSRIYEEGPFENAVKIIYIFFCLSCVII